MNNEEFRAALQTTIGRPPDCVDGLLGCEWTVSTPHGPMRIVWAMPLLQLTYVYLEFTGPTGPLPQGASAHGTWNIVAHLMNHPAGEMYESMLKELQRRLAIAGYIPPAAPVSPNPRLVEFKEQVAGETTINRQLEFYAEAVRSQEEPKPGSVWQHRNGNRYEVLFLTNDSSERQDRYPRTVVYRNTANGNRYSRALSDWHRSMTWVEDAMPLEVFDTLHPLGSLPPEVVRAAATIGVFVNLQGWDKGNWAIGNIGPRHEGEPAAGLPAVDDEERAYAIRQLRELCARYGNNDWPDDLHLGDILEKNLANYLLAEDLEAVKPAAGLVLTKEQKEILVEVLESQAVRTKEALRDAEQNAGPMVAAMRRQALDDLTRILAKLQP